MHRQLGTAVTFSRVLAFSTQQRPTCRQLKHTPRMTNTAHVSDQQTLRARFTSVFPVYLSCAMDCMRNAGVSIRDFNEVAIKLRAAVPKMMKIWSVSALQQGGRDDKIQANLRSADDLMKLVAEGKLTLEDPVPLDP
jgi:hypothetical protein